FTQRQMPETHTVFYGRSLMASLTTESLHRDNNDVPEVVEQRKADHIRINLEEDVSFRLTTGLGKYDCMHEAGTELNLTEIDTQTTVFGKTLKTPLLISSMTGGTQEAQKINRTLAAAAQQTGMAMGLGSQRAAVADAALAYTYEVRDVA